RMLLAFGLLFSLALVTLGGVLNRAPLAPGVTPENFRRLNTRMSRQDVEAILGPPTEPSGFWSGPPYGRWKGEHCSVAITFGGSRCSGTLRTEDGQGQDLPEPAWEQARRWMLDGNVGPWLVAAVPVASWFSLACFLWLLNHRCPGCRRWGMRRTAVVVDTRRGRRLGASYACGNCSREWFWSGDELRWHEGAAAPNCCGSTA